jgi:hypothetical protein
VNPASSAPVPKFKALHREMPAAERGNGGNIDENEESEQAKVPRSN